MSDGQSAFSALIPRSARLFNFIVNAVKFIPNSRNFVMMTQSLPPGPICICSLDSNDPLTIQLAESIGNASHQLAISPDGRYMIGPAPGHGTTSIQLSDLINNIVQTAAPAAWIDNSGSTVLGANFRLLSRLMQDGNRYFMALSWPNLISGDDRERGVVLFTSEALNPITNAFPIIAPQTGFPNQKANGYFCLPVGARQDNNAILSFDLNILWVLSHDSLSDTYYLSSIAKDYSQSNYINIPSFKNSLAATTPNGFLYNDYKKIFAFRMADNSIQIRSSIDLSLIQTLNFPNINGVTDLLWERLSQPRAVDFADSFWIFRSFGNGPHVARVSWSSFAIIEEFDLNALFGMSNTAPVTDCDYNPVTGEMLFAFGVNGSNAIKFQLATSNLRRLILT